MEDCKIIQLFWDRDEQAIMATASKYGAYCYSIAHHILEAAEDAEECVNDTYLKAWNVIPPNKPDVLAVFLGTITRNLALNRYKHQRALKRGGAQAQLVLEELSNVVSGRENVEEIINYKELVGELNHFLAALSVKKRKMFVCRYWYFDSVSELSRQFGMTENQVSVTLHRMRTKLKKYLTKRGYDL